MRVYEPRPKQLLFHNSTARECFFGGAKSPGKTAALVMDGYLFGMQYPGARVFLFRENYPALEDNIIREFKDFVDLITYKYNGQDHTATLINGSTVFFRYCSSLADALTYDGRNMHYLGIDEVTKIPWTATEQLMTCVRSADRNIPAIIRLTSNPGGIAHGEVKKRYITLTNNGSEMGKDPITGQTVQYIPANVYDGYLAEQDPTYAKRLEGLPEKKKQALLYGNWDIYEGQYFSTFGVHLREDPMVFPVLTDLKIYGGFDLGWGFNGVSSFTLGYRLRGCKKVHIAATLWLKGMTKSAQDLEIWDFLQSFHFFGGAMPIKIFCDTNIFATDGNGNLHVDSFKNLSKYMVPGTKSRINGWALLDDLFGKDPVTKEDKLAYWHGYNSALEETIPLLIHADNNPLDVEKCDIDHSAESLRFLAVGMMQEIGIDIRSKTNITPHVVQNLSQLCSAGNDTGMF